MGGNGRYALEVSLKDSLSGGLQEVERALSGVRGAVASLRGDFAALGKDSAKALESGAGLRTLSGASREQLDGLAKEALVDLDKAFQESGRTVAAYHEERRRQAGETAQVEREARENLASDEEAELVALREKHRLELETLLEHGVSRSELLQAQADQEVAIRQAQAEQEEAIDRERLDNAETFAGTMADAMKQMYQSGLAQSQGVFRMYQALAVAETTISTYKAAQAAYAQGTQWGGPVVGAVMAAAAIATGMARVASIRNTQPKGYAFGGLIAGEQRGERADNVLIRATPGEYMLDRPTVRHYGVTALEALRRREVPRDMLSPFASPRIPASKTRTAYAYGGEVGTASLNAPSSQATNRDELTVINVMDFQREFDRALASARGRRVLINVLGEEGVTAHS